MAADTIAYTVPDNTAATALDNTVSLVDNSSYLGNTTSTTPPPEEQPSPYVFATPEEKLIICFILGLISVFGTVGNGLVIYVFTRKSDKVTSTIFILALAWTDLFTCMLVVPFTVVNVQTDSYLIYDFACKAYQFLITFNVPLSPFIMVAIAIDRYFSICHPFLHAVTPRRARLSILCLCFFAFTLGTITALMYSAYALNMRTETVAIGEASWCQNITLEESLTNLTLNDSSSMISVNPQQMTPSAMPNFNSQDFQIVVGQKSFNTSYRDGVNTSYNVGDDGLNTSYGGVPAVNCSRNVTFMEYIGVCQMSSKYFSYDFIDTFANIQASFYAISLLVVFTLYFFIYRSVVRRRAWRRKQKSWSHSPMTAAPKKEPEIAYNANSPADEPQQENMELVSKNRNSDNDESADSGHGSNGGTATTTISTSANNKNENGADLKQQVVVGNGRSPPISKVLSSAEKKNNRERRDFNFLANIRTAVMLFVVTVVFIICFLPAWLMAANIIPFNVIIFYMYFTYNSANPIIYAFMNQSFRKELKRVFQRGTHFLRSG